MGRTPTMKYLRSKNYTTINTEGCIDHLLKLKKKTSYNDRLTY